MMNDDWFLEHRAEGSGIRIHGLFIPFIKPGDPPIDAIVCVPWHLKKVSGATPDFCSRCGCKVSVAPSSRIVQQQFPKAVIICMYCAIKEKNK